MKRMVEFLFRIIREDADYDLLHPILGSAPTLYLDASKTIHMGMRGDFIDPGGAVNFLTDRIRPIMILDGVEYPLGLLLPAKVNTVIRETGHHLNIQAYDQGWLLQTAALDYRPYYASGTKYVTAIDNLLDAAGIGLSIITDSDLTMSRAREDWMPGTNYLTVINDLLDEMHYSHIWFDLNGTAIAAPDPEPQNTPVSHVIDETDVKSLLIKDATLDTDFYSTPNVFIYMCSNFEKSPMIAEAINNDIGSPVSVPRRGRKIYSVTRVKDVASQTALQEMADDAADRSRLRTDSITVKTGNLPNFGINETVALNINGELSVCVERGWTMQLIPGGTMTHRMERVMANYD